MSDGGFFGGFGKGVAAAAEGTWEGAKALAKSGHALATDAQAREQAWNGAKQMADTVQQYGTGAMQEPATVWRDARNTAAAAWTAFDEFRSTAGPKEWGEVIGGGAFEVGTAFIPIGAATKLAKAGSAVDKLADAARLAEKLPDAPLKCIGPCQAVTATKRAMRLRDDLGPEHFNAEGQLKWPSNRGFATPPKASTLQPGAVIDRYSARSGKLDRGSFFSPDGTPYVDRALPYDPAKMKYTRYEVLRPLSVDTGAVAKAFGHKGGGTQYVTPLGTDELIEQGFLRKL